MVTRLYEADDKITARSFETLISKLEKRGYDCKDCYEGDEYLFLKKDGDDYQAKYYKRDNGTYELYLGNIHPTEKKYEGCHGKKIKEDFFEEDDWDFPVDFDDAYGSYEGLDEAIQNTESLCGVLDKFKYFADSVKEMNFDDSNTAIETFSGQDEVLDYSDFITSITDDLRSLYEKYWEYISKSGISYDIR